MSCTIAPTGVAPEIGSKYYDGKVLCRLANISPLPWLVWVVMITGAAGAIGTTAAVFFAQAGAKVVLVDLNPDALNAAAEKVNAAGGHKAIVATANVTNEEQVEAAVKVAVDAHGRIDHLFNNAGLQGEMKMLPDYPVDDFRKLMEVNVTGVFIVMQHVARAMIKTGGGTIVNSASHAAVRGVPTMPAYVASKSAVIGLTKSAAKDLAPHGIRVNCISAASIGDCFMWDRQNELHAKTGSPYYHPDPKVVGERKIQAPPLKRLGTVDEVARTVSYLLSENSSYITGFNIEISGGL